MNGYGFAAMNRLRKKVDSQSTRRKLLNYGPDAVGLRSPVAPAGFIVQDSGVTAMYAGRARVFVGLSGMMMAVADSIGLQGNVIYINPRDIRSFKILGRSFVPEIFEGKKKVVTVTKENAGKLSSMYMVTKQSRATEAGITDLHPLSEILEALDFFQSDYQCPDISLEKFQTLATGLGMSLGI